MHLCVFVGLSACKNWKTLLIWSSSSAQLWIMPKDAFTSLVRKPCWLFKCVQCRFLSLYTSMWSMWLIVSQQHCTLLWKCRLTTFHRNLEAAQWTLTSLCHTICFNVYNCEADCSRRWNGLGHCDWCLMIVMPHLRVWEVGARRQQIC